MEVSCGIDPVVSGLKKVLSDKKLSTEVLPVGEIHLDVIGVIADPNRFLDKVPNTGPARAFHFVEFENLARKALDFA
jgi:hypothetical protein